MPLPPLTCTVRTCTLPLERRERALVCPANHSYDIARRGYVNLLQPQDRRSSAAGDSAEAVAARHRLLSAGIGRTILEDIAQRAAALEIDSEPVVAELGSGSGDLLGDLAKRRSIIGVGIDISSAAAAHAARHVPGITWVVANADRRIPLRDHSVQLVITVHGRRNPAECRRILDDRGLMLVVVPGADDLVELRTFIEGRAVQRDRGTSVEREHEDGFVLLERTAVREQHRLERPALLDLLRATYRGERHRVAARVEQLTMLEITLTSEVQLFGVRPRL